jgi:hypothetical protein
MRLGTLVHAAGRRCRLKEIGVCQSEGPIWPDIERSTGAHLKEVMCYLTQPVKSVSSTRIFARAGGGGRQFLA